MESTDRNADATGNQKRLEQAETRTEQAEARTEQAKSRTELAETRTEQAETRTESAKTRTEQAETRTEQAEARTEQAETTLRNVVEHETAPPPECSERLLKKLSLAGTDEDKVSLGKLTPRQLEILILVAEGQNTKQIADILKVSPKTIEYHRIQLMDALNIHDVPGLVRFALRVGLIPQER